nr:LysE family translocator [Kurthia massiliensis]
MFVVLTFLLMTLFVVMSPGIDTALITKRTIRNGSKDGFQVALGITVGSGIHTLAATLGLSALLMQSALAFGILKWIGALYLIYLGVKSLLAKPAAPATTTSLSTKHAFLEGFLSNVLNPKVIVFFLTFLPQFITSTAHATRDFLAMGATYAVLSLCWFFFYVICLHYIREWLLSPRVQLWMERLTGVVLIGFGIKLLFTKSTV